ncbi:MAG: glycosyltransferase family 2 protein [Clostridia bacterium]|nr:glycosyltransferase family 2 protein [Clostridia bacterium]
MILLTIAVPSYNSEATLRQCLSSMCDERFVGRLDVVVVNDGSKDNTEAIAREFTARYPGIFRIVSKDNGGHGSGVNVGIACARGKYFRIVDSDDWVEPDGLAALLDAMENADADVFIDERVEIHTDEGFSDHIRLPQFANTGSVQPFEEIFGHEYFRNISMHTLTARTELLRSRNIRLLEHTFYVDMQYVIGVAAFAKDVYMLRNEVYCYRLGSQEQSVSYLNYVRNYKQHDRVLKTCADFCERRAYEMPDGREGYMRVMLTLLARTQFNIALIYNPDRREGELQARELDTYLARHFPWLARATRSRRFSARVLHFFGVGYPELQWIKAAAGRT